MNPYTNVGCYYNYLSIKEKENKVKKKPPHWARAFSP
jgi:hypothetical protein